MSLADLHDADQRLAILQTLEQDADYAVNETILQRALALVGHAISADKLRTHLDWLAEQGLVTITYVAEGDLHVAKLTRRGEDAAVGRTRISGVARPRP